VVEGAYYSKLLLLAKEQKRIDFVPVDPLMQIRAYFDIGGAGARADRSIWVAQFVGQKSTSWTTTRRKGNSLSVHIDWMRSRGWGKA
jgi:phage terminase large subunit